MSRFQWAAELTFSFLLAMLTVRSALELSAERPGAVRQVAPQMYELDVRAPDGDPRAAVNRNDYRVGPALEHGSVVGLRLLSAAPGSFPTRLGLKPGDVVRGFNGLLLDGSAHPLEIWPRLRDADRVVVDLERNGAPLRLTYLLLRRER